MRRRRPRVEIAPASLQCFVLWCRINPLEMVTNTVVAHRVLEAYAAIDDARPMAEALEVLAAAEGAE